MRAPWCEGFGKHEGEEEEEDEEEEGGVVLGVMASWRARRRRAAVDSLLGLCLALVCAPVPPPAPTSMAPRLLVSCIEFRRVMLLSECERECWC